MNKIEMLYNIQQQAVDDLKVFRGGDLTPKIKRAIGNTKNIIKYTGLLIHLLRIRG
jgi:hypothetical protein